MPVVFDESKLFLKALINVRDFFRFRKKWVAIVVFLVGILFMGSVALAAGRTPKERPGDWKENPGFFNTISFHMVKDIFTGDDTATVADQVKITYSSSGSNITIGGHKVSNLGTIIKSVNDMCKGLSIVFIIITFFLGLLSIREKEQMDEELLRRFVMLILGIACISFAMTWSFTIANIGSQMASKVASVGSGIQNAKNSGIVTNLQGRIWDDTHIANYDHGDDGFTGGFDWFETQLENFGMSVSYASELLVPWLLMKAARLLVSVVIWGRALEVIILAAFSPLGFAEVPDVHNPISGTGMRFIKNMTALSISGAIIVFVMFATNQIILNMFSDIVVGNTVGMGEIMDSVFGMVVVSFARVAMVTRSLQIAKSIVGAV